MKLPTGGGGGGSFPRGARSRRARSRRGSFPAGSFPRGSFPGGANSKDAKAFAACASKAPKGVGRGFGGNATPTAAQLAALKNYETCMAGKGIQIASSATYQTIRSLIASDKAAATANAACESDLAGAFGPGSRGGTPSSTG